MYEDAGSSSGSSSGSGGDGGGGEPLTAEQRLQRLSSSYKVPTSDVYDESQPKVRVLEWQSFLKASKEPKGSKCMG